MPRQHRRTLAQMSPVELLSRPRTPASRAELRDRLCGRAGCPNYRTPAEMRLSQASGVGLCLHCVTLAFPHAPLSVPDETLYRIYDLSPHALVPVPSA